jgi:acetyltransferase
MLNPGAIAVIGASETEESLGRTVMENLRAFDGRIYPINLRRTSVFGAKAYRNIGEVPGPVDLAVITTRAATVPDLVSECVAVGVRGAVVLSSGFKEAGYEGVQLEHEIMARRGEMRIIGPNSLGLMIPDLHLNATFTRKLALRGNVAFISQSAGLCTSVLDWSIRQKVGFSVFLSTGSMLDVGWGDLIDYLANDFHTSSILIYMESLGDARSFLSAAREMALRKPIIVIKAGSTETAAKAVASHTGGLTGDDTVIDSAFRRAGVLRVKTIEDLFCMAEVLSKQPKPKGPRLAILTNAGGPGVLATDILVAEGGEVAQLLQESVKQLNAILPNHWSRHNPVNVLCDAGPDRFIRAIEVLTGDSNVDGVLAIVTPQMMADPTEIARALAAFKNVSEKPILACWMGAADVAEGEAILNAAGIPTFQFPDAAARTFCYMWHYCDNLHALYETPGLSRNWSDDLGRSRAKKIIEEVRKSDRRLLTEVESKEVLAAYGIPTVETLIARSEEEAIEAANKLGAPLVLKLHSQTITHKSEAGGVKWNLHSESQVRLAYRHIEEAVRDKPGAFLGVTVEPMVESEGYELILGSSVDSQFGPVLLFGAGGQLVEYMRDYVLGLPPLNATLARRLMERTRIYKALQRTNVDLVQLESILVEFSLLVAEQHWIKEIDVNPLVVSDGQIVALDARIILHESATAEEDLPRLAIRPYPQQYVSSWNSKDGTPLTLRPIRPEDEPLMVKFHSKLSEETVYLRYFGLPRLQQRVAHERLTRICFNDYDREIALVAIRQDPTAKENEIIGVGRLTKVHGLNQAEFAILIADEFQGLGLGTKFLSRLVEIGRHEGIELIFGNILPENYPMQHVAKKVGFQVDYDRFNYVMRAELRLGS